MFDTGDGIEAFPESKVVGMFFSAGVETRDSYYESVEAGGTITVPQGTRLVIRTSDVLDSNRHGAGHRFRAQTESAVVVDGITRAVALEAVDRPVGAILRYERVLHHDVVGAGTLQAADVPVVHDCVVLDGDEESAIVRRLTGVRGWHHGAEEGPLAVFRAGGEAPVPGQPVAALDVFDEEQTLEKLQPKIARLAEHLEVPQDRAEAPVPGIAELGGRHVGA